ncbi:hypothetical protein BDV96DRAFT_658682 [Lophiotrema nucula]|uniref:Uncharacterized protein n=1 Tax=Lophiotrema nucula TaxID=690887 RepID=A0A6A5ZD83_9PLEO|nr:hypothetical protein BDV96DRAFT_658682 [Lophiotrema nucula]
MADSPDQHLSPLYPPASPDPQGMEMPRTSRLEVPERAPSRSASPTQYEFIMSTGEENASTRKKNLKTVRSQVMKNYLAQQQQRQRRGSNEGLMSTVGSERRKGKERARSSRSTSREVGDSSTSPTVSEGGLSVSADAGSVFSGFSWSMPFGGARTDAQFRLGSSQPFALDFNYNAPRDEVSKSAQSYVSSLLHDKRTGMLQPSFRTLDSKGETVRIVKDTLGICGNDVPESTIFAVNMLSFGCAIDCDWDEARGHLGALQRIIDARGGIGTIDFELQRTITWTTYCLAGALQLPTHFPIPSFHTTNAFPLAFLDDVQIRAWRTVKRFPKNNSWVFDIVARLHQLSVATALEWYNDVDQRAVSNLYFEAMQNVTLVSLEQPWSGNIPGGNSGQETATMFRVWAAGLPLFVWATARHLRTRMGVVVNPSNYDPLFARVQEMLDGPGGYHAWPRGKSLEPVLATLFYCVESCEFSNPRRMWFIENMRKVTEMLKLKAVDEFKKTLDYFPSTDEYRLVAEDVWREMVHGSSGPVTPTLTLSSLQ